MPIRLAPLLRPAPLFAAAAATALLASAVQPVAASSGIIPGARLHCTFSLRAPAPGATIDRRFQEVRTGGSCDRPVEQIPQIFVDHHELDVDGQGVADRFRFGGASALVNISLGTHTLKVVVHPRDPRIAPFVSTWSFTAIQGPTSYAPGDSGTRGVEKARASSPSGERHLTTCVRWPSGGFIAACAPATGGLTPGRL